MTVTATTYLRAGSIEHRAAQVDPMLRHGDSGISGRERANRGKNDIEVFVPCAVDCVIDVLGRRRSVVAVRHMLVKNSLHGLETLEIPGAHPERVGPYCRRAHLNRRRKYVVHAEVRWVLHVGPVGWYILVEA